jgi:hypothetical protein
MNKQTPAHVYMQKNLYLEYLEYLKKKTKKTHKINLNLL